MVPPTKSELPHSPPASRAKPSGAALTGLLSAGGQHALNRDHRRQGLGAGTIARDYAHNMSQLRLALAQVDPTLGDLAGNAALVRRWSAQARDAGAHVVAFP